jgi:8-oxo-dGTP diphosphatase|tara:strand:+ start:28 stop:450 length:423 start_codon:yes stop_codon:yes gene_type:complete
MKIQRNKMLLNVVGGILIHNEKILLVKRSNNLKVMPNKYEFPGGKVEMGETLQEALIRELKEELSIDINLKNIIEFPKNSLETDKLILTVFIVQNWKNKITLNPEINSEILPVKFSELKYIEELLDTNKLLIPSIIKFLI